METTNRYYEAVAPAAREKRAYTAAQKGLLLVALLVGVACDVAVDWSTADLAVWARVYAAFWLIAGGAYALYFRKKWNVAATVTGACAAALCALIFWRADMLLYTNMLALPLLMMLFACCLSNPVEKGREGYYAAEILKGIFVRPFHCIGRFFGAIGAAFTDAGRPKVRIALIGAAVAVPAAAVVLALLVSADGVMAYYASEAFRGIQVDAVAQHVFVTFLMTMLFYSLFYSLHYREKTPLPALRAGTWEPVAALIPVCALLACYALFGYVQFAYLFASRGLPDGLTYAQYAVEGFTQLVWVAALNFTLFGLCVRFTKPAPAMKWLLLALLIATALLLASALTRLGLYIGAYGLTVRRILSLWLMIYLCACTVLCAVKLFRKRFLLLRWAGLGLIVWYLVLNAVDLFALTAA